MSEYKEKMERAIQQALSSRAGNMLAIARHYFPNITATGYMKVCPYCQKSGSKFSVRKAQAGHWAWGCASTSCAASFDNLKASRMGDTIGLIAMQEGCERSQAINKLLDLAGVTNPREEFQERQASKTTSDSKKQESETPKAEEPKQSKPTIDLNDEDDDIPMTPKAKEPEKKTNIISMNAGKSSEQEPQEEEKPLPPDTQVWNRIHELLTLTPADAMKLKKERGFNDETIQRAGFKSSNTKNRQLLAPILDEFPHSILLSNGIAAKDADGGIKLNAQLCGYGLIKRGSKTEQEEWGGCDPILIPYRNKKGDIHFIRPHKGGLSGKRFMQENGFEFGFRSTRTRSHLYTNSLFDHRPDGWEHRIVLTEGEFKGEALAQANIPAAAVPGIQMPRNECFFEAMTERFRAAQVREIIVCYDNEDKSSKPDPWTRHDAKVYALYACHALRAAGFLTHFLELPDEWRDNKGKADWDGALANFGKNAETKFKAVVKKAKPYYPQTELFEANEEQRIIHCKLNRLLHNPQILIGGDAEEELARLILKTPTLWKKGYDGHPPIAAKELAKELFETRGCYYVRKNPPEKSLPRYYALASEIKKIKDATHHEDLEGIAELEAALAAVNHMIQGRPETLSDFTISCDFQVRTQSGEIHRLFKFKNKHGQVSGDIVVPPSACSTSTKFREFCMGIGNFNPKIGDKQLQELMQDLGTVSAWREIRELEMLGRDPESNLWVFGDCAFTPDNKVLFADKHDIIWHDGIGYRIDPDDLQHFVHKTPPKFFRMMGKTPSEVYQMITETPEAIAAETGEVARIFFQQSADYIASFGSHAGLLAIGNNLSYAAAPELLKKYNAHAGSWIHGRMSAGKTEMARFQLMTWGYDSEFRTQVSGGGTTAVSIDRFLAQYSDIPVNIDEFREKEADATRNGTLRACFNRQGKTKGRMDQTNKTRSVQPRTAPIVTGEGVTNDSATLSRYVELVLAKDRRLGTPEQQAHRYNRMIRDQYNYHQIVRYIMMNRTWFSKALLEKLEEFLQSKDVIDAIPQDRLRYVYGTAWAAYTVLATKLQDHLALGQSNSEAPITKPDLLMIKEYSENFREETISYSKNANADVASINFVIRFWQNVVICMSVEHEMKNFIHFARCQISDTNKVTVTNLNTDLDGTVRCIIVQSGELYAIYERFMRSRGISPDLSLQGILGEIRRENYWVPAPQDMRNKSHRFSGIWSNQSGQKTCWVLRYDKMEPALQQVFTDHFESDSEDSLSI